MKIFAEVAFTEYESELISASKLELPGTELFNENAKDYDDLIIEHLEEIHKGDSFNHIFELEELAYMNKNIFIEYTFHYCKIIEVNVNEVNFEAKDVFYISHYEYCFNKYVRDLLYPVCVIKMFDSNNNEIEDYECIFKRIVMYEVRKRNLTIW